MHAFKDEKKKQSECILNGVCFFSWKGELMYTHAYKMPSINLKYY